MKNNHPSLNAWLKGVLFTEETEPIPPPYAHDQLLSGLVNDGIAPLVYYRLRKKGLSHHLSPDVWQTLETLFLLSLGQNFRLRQDVAEIIRCFNGRGISSVILKGLALNLFYYPHPATRPMTDVDILLKKEEVPLAHAYLMEKGYMPIDSTLEEALSHPPSYLSSLEYHAPDTRPIIHLHWHLINTSVPFPAAVDYPLADLWQEARNISIEGVPCRIPSTEHLILHLTEHGLKVNHSFDRLILIYDLYAVCCKDRIDWNALGEMATQSGLSPFLYFGLRHLARWDNTLIPPHFLSQIEPKSLSPLQNLYLKLIDRDIRIRGLSYLLYLSFFRGLRRKAFFVYRTLFPPLAVARQRVRTSSLPAMKVYWLRLKEIGRLLKRLFQALIHRADEQASIGRRRF